MACVVIGVMLEGEFREACEGRLVGDGHPMGSPFVTGCAMLRFHLFLNLVALLARPISSSFTGPWQPHNLWIPLPFKWRTLRRGVVELVGRPRATREAKLVDNARRILLDRGLEDVSLGFDRFLLFLLPSALAFRECLTDFSTFDGGSSSSSES
jgi:hypothetical protein